MPEALQAAHLQKKNFKCKQARTHNEVQVEFNVIPGRTTWTKAVRSAHAYGLLVTNQTRGQFFSIKTRIWENVSALLNCGIDEITVLQQSFSKICS